MLTVVLAHRLLKGCTRGKGEVNSLSPPQMYNENIEKANNVEKLTRKNEKKEKSNQYVCIHL